MILLPLLFLLLLAYRFREGGDSGTDALVKAAVALGLSVVAVTEVLSLFRLLHFLAVCMVWAVAIILVLRLRNRGRRHPSSAGPSAEATTGLLPLTVLAVVLTTTLLIALVAAPNTWDSMTYHLGRVSHWIANQSVAHYPTNIERQLWLNPFAEFGILNLQILSGGSDRFANLVQWCAFAGSLVVISGIVTRLGGSRVGAVAAAVFAATTPELILQSTSTQNDLVAGFWLLCVVFLGIGISNEVGESQSRTTVLWAAAALGLALLTKPTALVFGAPFLIWLAIRALRPGGTGIDVRSVVLGLVLFVTPIAPHLLRNWSVYSNPLGNPKTLKQLRRETLTAGEAVADLIKNLSPHFAMRSRESSEKLEHKVVAMGKRVLKVDLYKNEGWGVFRIPDSNTHEDWAGNPLQLVFGTVAIGWVLARWRRAPSAAVYAACAALAFLLFCLVFRWQSWSTRLQVPFFLVLPPVIGVAVSGMRKWTLSLISVVLLVLARPALFKNESRPLLGADSILRRPRVEQYFANRPDLYEPYWHSVATLWRTGCREAGLKGHEDILEYPLWQIAKLGGSPIRFEHALVESPSGKLAMSPASPCALLAVEQPPEWAPKRLPFAHFASVLDFAPVRLFQPRSASVSDGLHRPSKKPLSLVLVSPCRVVDTRGNRFSGLFGPPALAPEKPREFPLSGSCGVPRDAVAVQANVTVTGAEGAGYLLAYATGEPQPTASVLNFGAGASQANAAVLGLGPGGSVTVMAGLAGTHLIIDVHGYYVPERSARAGPYLWAALLLVLAFLAGAASSVRLRAMIARVRMRQKFEP